ncbi:GIN domain-containing protein [Mucilaginibacter psychrotolerans]|nr:DUF2807 domain-containing protein [Mucilaginibacter psychrotolerans]
MKMKNLFLTAIAIIALSTTAPVYANTIKDDAFTILEDVGTISSIEVHGNVQLFVSDAPADVIKVYNKYYAENALIQNKGGALRISSYNDEKLIIWVKATDLRSVSLFDNAQIVSFGTLSKIDFSIDLHNNAQAQLTVNAFKLTVAVKNNAKADIKGSTEELYLNRDMAQNVATNNLAVVNLYQNKTIAAAGKLVSAI